jgi:hypothetical protein
MGLLCVFAVGCSSPNKRVQTADRLIMQQKERKKEIFATYLHNHDLLSYKKTHLNVKVFITLSKNSRVVNLALILKRFVCFDVLF